MKRFISILLLSGLILAGCSSVLAPGVSETTPAKAVTLNVFAASSLTDAFTEIGENFKAANPGVAVTFNFAGSQALHTQIEEGAPADVFASASIKEMEAAVAKKFIVEGTSQIFLHNKLVIILPADNPADLENLEDLANAGVKIVLAAEEVPVGSYARQALDLMNGSFGVDFKDKVLANVVSNEDNVRQVVSKVQLGEADAGIAYVSDIVALADLKTIEIPAELNVIAKYPIAPLADSENAELAQAFVEYVLSAEGQAVLQKWGFAPPN
jgi:molybdate transport system substrate-binding protein